MLFSGDVGFYSGALKLHEELSSVDAFDVEMLPGVSSVQYFCAKVPTTWQDAYLISVHGRACNVCGAVRSHAKTFVLTGGAVKAQDVCHELDAAGLGAVEVWIGERLSYADERIVCSGCASWNAPPGAAG